MVISWDGVTVPEAESEIVPDGGGFENDSLKVMDGCDESLNEFVLLIVIVGVRRSVFVTEISEVAVTVPELVCETMLESVIVPVMVVVGVCVLSSVSVIDSVPVVS